MAVAWLITFVGVGGIVFGALGHLRAPSTKVAAAGGGLLAGIALFWLLPEISSALGWLRAAAVVSVICLLLLLLDRQVGHRGSVCRKGVLAPLLAAAAVHSFLDGWSVRAMPVASVATVAVPIGLALHKIPEGLVLGWITRRALNRTGLAIALGSAVELLTGLGAFVEPLAEHSGFLAFGPMWPACILAVAGGSFLFLGVHSVVEGLKEKHATLVFLSTLAVLGLVATLGH